MGAAGARHAPATPKLARLWRWATRRYLNGQKIAYVALFLVVANLVIAPLAMVLLTSINLGPITLASSGATLANHVNAWTSSSTHVTITNTLIFALGSTLISVTIGVFFAFLVERTDMPFRTFAYTVVPLTIAMPGMLYSIAWALLLSPKIGLFNLGLLGLFGAESGLLTSWAGIGFREAPINGYSMAGMILADGLRGVAVVFLMTVGLFRNMDPALEEAASVSGARGHIVARVVTLRLMAPGILAALLYSFTGNLESFELPAVLGLPSGIYVLSTKIYLLTSTGDHGLASALGVIFLVLAVFFVYWYSRLTRRIEQFTTVTGKGYRPRVMHIGRVRPLAAGLVCLYLAVVILAPFVVILWASLLPYYQVPSWAALGQINLDAYGFVLTHPSAIAALKNTLIVTFATPLLTMLLATLISWFVVRTRMRGKRLLDVLAFLPHTVPSTIIAIAFIYLFLTPPWAWTPIYGSIWIIALALGTRYLAFGSRTMHGAALQIHKELEEAAHVGGVSWPRTIVFVIAPLLLPSIVAGWVFVAMHAVRDATMALMLASSDSRVIPLLMWDSWMNGHVSEAAATGVFLMAAIAAIIYLGRVVENRRSSRYWRT